MAGAPGAGAAVRAASCAKIDFSRGRKSEARAVHWCLCAAGRGYLRQLPDLILPPGSRRETLGDQALLLSGQAHARVPDTTKQVREFDSAGETLSEPCRPQGTAQDVMILLHDNLVTIATVDAMESRPGAESSLLGDKAKC